MKKNLLLSGLVVSFALACGTANATKMSNLTTNSVLFFDDFESAPGVSSSAWEDTSGDYDPVASVGSWLVGNGGFEGGETVAGSGIERFPQSIQVTNVANNGVDPGPIQGSNYLRLDRQQPPEGTPSSFAPTWSFTSEVQSNPGDVIQIDTLFAVNQFAAADSSFQIEDSDGTRMFTVYYAASSSRLLNRRILPTQVDTQITTGVTKGEWHRLTVEYTLGNSEYSVIYDANPLDEIAGVRFDNLLVETVGNGSFRGARWGSPGHNSANVGVLYLDAVLPPSNLSGDYNDDGFVDAADYVMWRDALGSTTTLPNDTTSDSVTEEDYVVWTQFYGSTNEGFGNLGAGGVAVPEPDAAWLLWLMAGGVGSVAWRSGLARRIQPTS